MADSPGRTDMLRVIAEAVVPLTKPAGFRKSGMNFHRRRGEAVQVLGFRMNVAGCCTTRCEFGADLGLSFDSMCELAELPILDKPSEADCDYRVTRDSLNEFIALAPELWRFRPGGDTAKIALSVHQCTAAAIQELDQIDGIPVPEVHGLDPPPAFEGRCQAGGFLSRHQKISRN